MSQGTGLEPTEGTYRYRARRGAPWQPVRILNDGELWHVLLNGEPVKGSGRADWLDVAFLKYNWPLHPISLTEYYALKDAYAAAPPGSPLTTPDEPVNLREATSV